MMLTKRQERDSVSSISSKRLRRTPALDVTQVSDSIKESPSQMDDLRAILCVTEQKLAEESRARIAVEELLASKERQLDEIKSSLGELQTRYESRMKLSHKLRREYQTLQAEKDDIEKRREKVSVDNAALKE